MALPTTPTAPKPATPSPAPAAKPAAQAPKPATPAPAPAAKPATPAAPRNDQGQFTSGPRQKATPMNARKALGLAEDPSKAVAKIVESARKNLKSTQSYHNAPGSEPAPSVDPITPAPVAAAQPAAPAAPEVTAPAAPAPAAPETTPAATSPAKVKIGDKEYSPEEIAARIAELEKAALSTMPQAPTPAAPAAPAAEAPKPKTPEEIKAAEDKWISEAASQFQIPVTEAELDTILAGGKDAVKALAAIRSRDIATALLAARKDISALIGPHLEQLQNQVVPLVGHYEQIQRYAATQEFVKEYPDFAPHVDLAVQVAEQLIDRYPEQFSALTDAQRRAEVARQTDLILSQNYKRFNPAATGTWRDAVKAAAPAAPAPAAAAPPAPAAPLPPAVKPLASNPPSSQGGAVSPDFQSSAAKALRKW